MSNHAHLNVRKAAGAAGLAVGLAVGGYGIASAATGSTSTTTPSGTQPATTPNPSWDVAGPRMGRPFGPGGTITAIAANSVTVQERDGTSRTVNTDASTTYRKDGAAASRSDLAVGQRVAVRAVRASAAGSTTASGSATASEIDIISPRLDGTVTQSDGSTVTITDDQGFSRTIHVSSATTYDQGGQATNVGAVTVGKEIVATGTIDANKTDLDATRVSIVLPSEAGVVQSVSGNTITLQGHEGTTQKVTTTSATTYRSRTGQAAASDVKQGVFIVATGQRQADGSLAASSILVGPAGGPGLAPGGPFHGGARFGGGPGPDWGSAPATSSAGLA